MLICITHLWEKELSPFPLSRGEVRMGVFKEDIMDLVEEQLRNSKTIAVVGLSDRPQRDSHRVAKYLQSQGYRIIPVNPMIKEALGEKSYPDLKSVPEPIDMVDIFRRSELVPPVVDEAIEVGVKYIWMQDGVIHPEAAARAEAAGIPVIMND
jgi:uncharacterized protein